MKMLCYYYNCLLIFLSLFAAIFTQDQPRNNAPANQATWSQWTYSTCQSGRKVRIRQCSAWKGYICPGPARQTLPCQDRSRPPIATPHANNDTPRRRGRYFISPTFGAVWSPWSTWTICQNNRQDRIRACHRRVGYRCDGPTHQARQCQGEETEAETKWRDSQKFYSFDSNHLVQPITSPKPQIFRPKDFLRMNPRELSKDWAMAQLGIGDRRWFAASSTTTVSLTTVSTTTVSPTTIISSTTKASVPDKVRVPSALIKSLVDYRRSQRPTPAPENRARNNIIRVNIPPMPPPPPENPLPDLVNPPTRSHKEIPLTSSSSSQEYSPFSSAWNFGSNKSPRNWLAQKFGLSDVPKIPALPERQNGDLTGEKQRESFRKILKKYYQDLLEHHGTEILEEETTEAQSRDLKPIEDTKILESTEVDNSQGSEKDNSGNSELRWDNYVPVPEPHPESHPEPHVYTEPNFPNERDSHAKYSAEEPSLNPEPKPEPKPYYNLSNESENINDQSTRFEPLPRAETSVENNSREYHTKPVPEPPGIPKPSALVAVSSHRRAPMEFSDFTPIFIPADVSTTTPLPRTTTSIEPHTRRPLRVRGDHSDPNYQHRSRKIEPWSAPLIYGPNLKPSSSEIRPADQNSPTYWLFTVYKDRNRRKNNRSRSKIRSRGRDEILRRRNKNVTFLPGFGQASSAEWSSWSEWSTCTDKSKRSRTRRCNYSHPFLTIGCAGPSYEVANCGWSSLLDLLPDPSQIEVQWESDDSQESQDKLIVFAKSEETTDNRRRRSRRKFAALQRRRLRFMARA